MIGKWFYDFSARLFAALLEFRDNTWLRIVTEVVEFMTGTIGICITAALIFAAYIWLLVTALRENAEVVYHWEKEEKRAAKKLQRQKEKERREVPGSKYTAKREGKSYGKFATSKHFN